MNLHVALLSAFNAHRPRPDDSPANDRARLVGELRAAAMRWLRSPDAVPTLEMLLDDQVRRALADGKPLPAPVAAYVAAVEAERMETGR